MNIENNISVFEIQELIKEQTERGNIGAFWFFCGLIFILIGLDQSLELVSLGIGIVLFGLEKIINGNSLKSRYMKMLPNHMLPAEIDCIKCGNKLELDLDERLNGKYFCPFCNQIFRQSIESE